MYSINGNFILNEKFGTGFNFDKSSFNIDTDLIKQQSNEQGSSTINQDSTSVRSGDAIKIEETKQIIRIEKESTSENTFSAITDVSKIQETNEVIKNETKKMTDSFTINENKINPFNIFDSNIETDVFPYLLPNTSNISIGNYLGIYMTFVTGNIINNQEMLINFPSGYTAGITLVDSKITPFIGMWWGSDISKFIEFEDYVKKEFIQNDGSKNTISNKFDDKAELEINIVKKLKIMWRQNNILVEMKLLEKKFISIVLKIRT